MELSLAQMRNSDKHLNKLLKCLGMFSRLKSLDLSGNQMSLESAKTLSTFLMDTPTLERLNLSKSLQFNSVNRTLLSALTLNQSILYLNLSMNKFNHGEFEHESAVARLVKA